MVGAGTGIAPFRSFWQHFDRLRETKQADKLEVTLIFGCRNSKLDHIYQDEIEALRNNGTIQHFYLALSREHNTTKVRCVTIILFTIIDFAVEWNTVIRNVIYVPYLPK